MMIDLLLPRARSAFPCGARYLLATCTFTPLYGRLCNVMGRRAANQIAVAFAAVGTAACGLSSNMEMLIAARFVRHTRQPCPLNANEAPPEGCGHGRRRGVHDCIVSGLRPGSACGRLT